VDSSCEPVTDESYPDAKRRRIAEIYLKRHGEVEGWLEDIAARVSDRLLQAQAASGITGDVMEIGVHHGRYFIVLANGLVPGESAIAVDIFSDQHLNTSRSGKGNWTEFVSNVARFAPLAHVDIVQANSTALGDDFVAARCGMRFISIDGGHDRATSCSDLALAERLATSGAIVALDDIYRPDWSGVTAGLAKYLSDGGTLRPFVFIPNKLLLTTDAAWAESYRDLLRQEFAAYCDRLRPSLELFWFDDVLLIWDRPQR
jgi:hypothetical protein